MFMRALFRVLLTLAVTIGFAASPSRAASVNIISLDGDWSFVPDPSGTLKVQDVPSASNIRPTRVPSSWQSQFIDMRDYAGVAWYWRSVTLEAPAPGQVVLLRFAAADYLAEVYFNGFKAGSHEGGYLPFDFDVTLFARAGENHIAVRVADPGAKPDVVEGIRYADIPHGKQNWYVQTSGLWQHVELEVRPVVRLGNVHITAGEDGNFKVSVPVITGEDAAQPPAPIKVDVEIRSPAGDVAWRESRTLGGKESSAEFSGRVPLPDLWSPSSPTLYTLSAALSSGDSQTAQFGFRTFETRDGKFSLNGKVIYLRAALDQDFYPETVYTPPSLDFLRDEMRKAKLLGLNMLRCHIKVPDPRYLQAADEVGMLIWYEIPNWDKLTADSQRRAMETLRGMVERDWNHPSIVIVSIMNESWGADLKNAADRRWLRQAYQEAKGIVPRWLVQDNSPCCDNFHVATDIADFHQYVAIPDYAANFDRLIADQATRPGWLFSPYGDAAPRGDEPLLLSEFGNWGLPRLPDPLPWWFARDHHGEPGSLPAGVEKRFAEYQYGSLFKDFSALAEATQWHQYHSLKYEIESLRSHPEIQGYIITEFTDVNWESNGLLDMWRRPKVYGDIFGKLQQDDLVMARAERRNYYAKEEVAAEVYVSHYSQISLVGAVVAWEIEGTSLKGGFAFPTVAVGSSERVGKIDFTVPEVAAPVKKLLKVRLIAGGRTISEDSTGLAVFFYPPKSPDLPPPVSFHDPAGRLRRLVNEMRERGYQAPSGNEAFPVLISSVFDDEVKRALQAGGRVILMASDQQTIAPELEIVPRSKENLDGNWISSFPWTRNNQEPFKPISFETFAGFETQAVTPGAVLKGVPPENFNDVLAGIFYGWVHSNVGTLVQAQAGKGKLLICTYSLSTAYGSDPYATYLLDGLVNYAASGFAPRYQIPLQ